MAHLIGTCNWTQFQEKTIFTVHAYLWGKRMGGVVVVVEEEKEEEEK